MARKPRNGAATAPRPATGTKYDAHNQVLKQAYGAFADLRRELADSKSAVAERTELLNLFSHCADSQRAWLLLEDYLEKLRLSRRDFPGEEWWPRMLASTGRERLEDLAMLFLRAGRPLPPDLAAYANFTRFAEIEKAEQEQSLIHQLEQWLLPPAPTHLDAPRAGLRVICEPVPLPGQSALFALNVEFSLHRPRTGDKLKTVAEILDLVTRAAHEQELFPAEDWAFIQWLHEHYRDRAQTNGHLGLQGVELLQWLVRWGDSRRLVLAGTDTRLQFRGQLVELSPHLQNHEIELSFTHRLRAPDGTHKPLTEGRFFPGQPPLVLLGDAFYLVRNAPPENMLAPWLESPLLPVQKLSHRLLKHLRRTFADSGADWEQLCIIHTAVPQFTFEIVDETVRLRLLARSERDAAVWQWNGHEWQKTGKTTRKHEKPEVLDDPRLEPATQWLKRLDWFTPEPGLWVGDANEAFLNTLANAWPYRPEGAEFLGNPGFHRLFLSPRPMKPKLILRGSGIDWLSVSAEWEVEGMKLTKADLERLASATGRFVKLPDSGWVELDVKSVQSAHEAMADLGVDGLSTVAREVDMLHASQAQESTLDLFGNRPEVKELRQRVAEFRGVESRDLPPGIQAELRPYQKDGYDFLCHLTKMKLGGILADDMGLGKTLQTLSWLASLKHQSGRKSKPALVICPASVLHNWRREANRFVPELKVLVLESGAARHNLRKQIPENDIIVTNYALLRRDLEELQKFEFGALVLDEAQFIKNPQAQVTQSVKQLRARHRLALTGTPLENRLLDLWSIVDFIQPAYLGSQADFLEVYEPRGEDPEWSGRVARRRLSAKLRPLMLRRLKKQVARDLPDRLEERRDCELGEEQRKLYLAELRRSRDQVMKVVSEKGAAKAKMHVLAALTRLRQICCHPTLVGSDSPSGKTETLFEMLEPLLAEGEKVLVFSQFVQMLKLIEAECQTRGIATHMLTGETKDRQEAVNAFQADPRPAVFLLSLRAAGTGLNLTSASYVVLYDPWWNPAVEAQAIDRSHRIGQTRNVFAYRLIAPGTVEEKIWDLQQRKAQTISDVLGEEGFAKSLSQTDLEYLFSEE
jgi:superfamily II DNA or RNA helicase